MVRGGGACIMVLAREVWNCVHKLNYFNLRGRERENNGEWLCECVLHLHVKHTRVCVLMEGEKETHFYSSTGARIYKWEYKPVAGDYSRGQVLPCSWALAWRKEERRQRCGEARAPPLTKTKKRQHTASPRRDPHTPSRTFVYGLSSRA